MPCAELVPKCQEPGARFVTGGDRGTDFSITNHLGALLRKLFFTLDSSKKQQGEIFFFSPAMLAGGEGGIVALVTAVPSFRGITRLMYPQPSSWSHHTVTLSYHRDITHSRGCISASLAPRMGEEPGGGRKGEQTARGCHALWSPSSCPGACIL